MSSTWVQPPAGYARAGGHPGPERAEAGHPAQRGHRADVDGIQCQAGEQTVVHVHTHLTIFVNGKAQVIPYGIGIPGFQAVQHAQGPFVQTGSCFYWLHVHANDGIIHIESPSTTESFTLGQFFDEWGIPLSNTQVGPATGTVTVFFTSPGKKAGIYTGNPTNLPLGDHYQIQLDVGTPIVAPVQVTNWGGCRSVESRPSAAGADRPATAGRLTLLTVYDYTAPSTRRVVAAEQRGEDRRRLMRQQRQVALTGHHGDRGLRHVALEEGSVAGRPGRSSAPSQIWTGHVISSRAKPHGSPKMR